MKPFMLAAAASAALIVTGCGHDLSRNIGAEPGSGRAARASAAIPSDMTPTDAMGYMTMAGASDLYEIQSSQMALQRASRPEVRQYAQMLIQHHQMTTQQVMAAAQAAGMAPPSPQLLPMQRQMLERLSAASEASFDAAYIGQQVPAHEMALALHSNYAQNGDTPSLRGVAGTAVPIVTQHLNEARRMMGMM